MHLEEYLRSSAKFIVSLPNVANHAIRCAVAFGRFESGSRVPSTWRNRALLLALIMCGLSLNVYYRGLIVSNQAIYPDDGHFTTVGWLMAKHDYVPYRDIFDHKPPLTYLVIALSTSLSESVSLTRWPFALTTIISGASLATVGWMWFESRRIGALAALFYLFDFSVITWGSIPRTETLAASTGITGIALCVLASKRNQRSVLPLLLAGGIFLGLSFLSKQNAVFYLFVALPSVLGIVLADASRIRSLSYFAAPLVGFSVPLLLTWMYLQQHGALADAIEQVFYFNTEIATPRLYLMPVALMAFLLFVGNPIIWIGAIASLIPTGKARQIWIPLVLALSLALLCLAMVVVLAPTDMYLNEFVQVILASSRRQLGVGLFGTVLFLIGWPIIRKVRQPRRPGVLQCDWFLLLATGAVVIPNNALYGDQYTPNYDTSFLLIAPASLLAASFVSLYLSGFRKRYNSNLILTVFLIMLMPIGGRLWHGNLSHQLENATLIEKFVPQGQAVYMFPVNSGYYFLTGRLPGSRYAYISHLVAENFANDEASQSTLETDLAHVPKLIVWNDGLEGFGPSVEWMYESILSHRSPLFSTEEFTIFGDEN